MRGMVRAVFEVATGNMTTYPHRILVGISCATESDSISIAPEDRHTFQQAAWLAKGTGAQIRAFHVTDFVDDRFGEPTVRDILGELEKPGRDPRPAFRTATFKEGVEEMKDLQPGMVLEGVVSNVTNFGAFVDIGVHQDGLVHISAMADRFVKDPREITHTGALVKVRVTVRPG